MFWTMRPAAVAAATWPRPSLLLALAFLMFPPLSLLLFAPLLSTAEAAAAAVALMVRVAVAAEVFVVEDVVMVEEEQEGGGEAGMVWERLGRFDGGSSEGGREGGER